ncbi:TPA: Rrf2 family transcriptional regulator [Clostridium perfringens]|nr:Rrf2 family transcriptional regulator [Clostridium perfringens]
MQLKLSTDYAIRIVLYLAMKKRKVSLKELSEKLVIDECYVLKFSKKLHKHGIVAGDNNMQDGFYLMKDPNNITMYEIIKIMENTVKINLCLEEDKYCSRFSTENCPVRNFYCELQNNIESYLKSKTIYALLKDLGSGIIIDKKI